jgi:hypothetical protein
VFDWLNQYSRVLIALADVGVLLVWLFYAQLALNGILKNRRPRILINQVKGRDMNAEVIVANMSEQKIFVQMLLAAVQVDGEQYTHAITDAYVADDDDPERISERTSTQGPLAPGTVLEMGSFHQVARRLSRGASDETSWQSIELRIIFFHGSTSAAVMAKRSFQFIEDEEGTRHVEPETMDTTHMYRKWHRRRIKRWLREYG